MDINDWVQIGKDGDNYLVWNVLVTDISEGYTIVYTDKTKETLAAGAPLTLDPIGTRHSHEVTFARKRNDRGDFDRLYDYLSKPRYEGIDVNIVHGQTKLAYTAYVSTGNRSVLSINESRSPKVHWDKMEVTFLPVQAQEVPEED